MKYTDAMPPAFQKSGKEPPMRQPEMPAGRLHLKNLNLAGEVRKRLKKKLVPQMDMDTDNSD